MALFSEEFAGWQDSDFAAFDSAKWRSNRFTPERTKVRLRLAAALESAVAAAGLSPAGLELWSSRQEPAFTNQHEVRSLTVAWTRAGAENVDTAHIYAGVVIDQAGVTLRLRLPGEQQAAWRPMQATLAELAGLAGMGVKLGETELTPEALTTSELAGDLLLERMLPRAEAIGGLLTVDELAAWSGVVLPLLVQVLGVTVAAVTPVLAAELAAEPESGPEPTADETEVAEAEPPTQPSLPGASRDPPARRGYRPQWTPQTQARAGQAEAMRPPIDRIMPPTWHPEPIRRPEPTPYAPPPRRPEPMRQPQTRRPDFQSQPQRSPERSSSFAPGRPFELGPTPQKPAASTGVLAAGARVELQKGLFAGKTGTVAEVSGAHVQVLLGLMSVRVPATDLRVL